MSNDILASLHWIGCGEGAGARYEDTRIAILARAEIERLRNEIDRLRAGGCARAEQEETQDKQRWRHKQRGTTYAVEGNAMLQTAEPLSDYTQLIVYRCERTGDLWARPVSEFRDGRFEQITSQEKTND